MSADPKINDLFTTFFDSTNSAHAVSARPLASAQGEQVEKTATSRGTAREVIDAKPDNLVVPTTPNTTASEQSGGASKK